MSTEQLLLRYQKAYLYAKRTNATALADFYWKKITQLQEKLIAINNTATNLAEHLYTIQVLRRIGTKFEFKNGLIYIL